MVDLSIVFGMFTTGMIPAGFPRSWYDNEWGYSNRISDAQRGTGGNGLGWGALGMGPWGWMKLVIHL